MANIFNVAKHILDTKGGEMSAMKLQKLCYYCQAWNLVWENEPLFNEDFLRWDNGPVCRELFDLHRGLYYVDSELFDDESILSRDKLTPNQMENMEQVLDEYMQFGGAELSEMTHSEAPWLNTPKDEIISKECIRDYYSARLASEKD